MVLPPCFLNGRFAVWENTWRHSHGSSQAVLSGMAFMALGLTSRSHAAAWVKRGPGSNGPIAPAKPLSPSLCYHFFFFFCLIFVLSRDSPSFLFPVSSALKAALLQPSLLPKYSPERPSVGLCCFLPAISFPPVILPSQPCVALAAHPTLCLAGAASGQGAQQPHEPSPLSRGALLQLSAAPPSLLHSPALVWRIPMQLVLKDRQVAQGLVSKELSYNGPSHGFFPGKFVGFRIRSWQALGHLQWDVSGNQEATNTMLNTRGSGWLTPSAPVPLNPAAAYPPAPFLCFLGRTRQRHTRHYWVAPNWFQTPSYLPGSFWTLFPKWPAILPAWQHAHFFPSELSIPGAASKKISLGLKSSHRLRAQVCSWDYHEGLCQNPYSGCIYSFPFNHSAA